MLLVPSITCLVSANTRPKVYNSSYHVYSIQLRYYHPRYLASS
jgi:hypothetical protein